MADVVLFEEIPDHARGGHEGIEGVCLLVQVAMVAGERDRVSRPDGAGEGREIPGVAGLVVDDLFRVVDDLATRAGIGGAVAPQHEVDGGVVADDLPQWQAHHLGVIGIEQNRSGMLDDDGAVEEDSEVVTRQGEPRFELDGFAVLQLLDIVESQVVQVIAHPQTRGLRDQYLGRAREPAQRGSLEMIPMDVRQVNEIRFQRCDESGRDGRIVPP